MGPGEVPHLAVPRPQQDDALQMLRNLHDMMKSGGLSESEFRTKKWELLSAKLKQLLFARLVAPLRPPWRTRASGGCRRRML